MIDLEGTLAEADALRIVLISDLKGFFCKVYENCTNLTFRQISAANYW